jgi:micrococcal nuclease
MPRSEDKPTISVTPTNKLATNLKDLSSAKVIKIHDGDTISADSGQGVIKIRLACIDAPESNQKPWGDNATKFMQSLTPVGTTIQYRVADIDRYGRTVAEVYRGNVLINVEMVANGYAPVYQRYLSSCVQTQNEYLQSEAQAKSKRMGFWNQASICFPWDFRRKQCQ